MENYLYTCQYCSKQYKPNRRIKQKYCSNSCRTRAFVIRNGKELKIPSNEISKIADKKSESMSWAGVGNAAAGTLALNLATNLFTNEENKPATKKDLKNLMLNLNQRYHSIKNISNRPDGTKPYYDSETQCIVYLTKSINYGTKKH
jgi:hypothetical protein